MNTLILVTYPANALELQVCVDSFRRNMAEEFDFLIITESYHVAEVEQLVPGERVIAMTELDNRIEALHEGYARQMAAKLLAVRAVNDGHFAVFIDDDVLPMDKFNGATFTDEDGKPVIFYTRQKFYPWMYGQRFVFGRECDRRFQLAMPYAQSLVSLRDLIEQKEIISRAFQYWAQDNGLSEFQIMGEFELKNPHGEDTLRRMDVSKTHWTIDREVFKDWQNQRAYMRIYLEETGQTPITD